MTGNEIVLCAALTAVIVLGVIATRIAWRLGVVDGAQNRDLPHVAAVLRDENVTFHKTWRREKGGQNGPADWPAVRPAPPPPMHRGSSFPQFDVDVPMPAGTRNPKV